MNLFKECEQLQIDLDHSIECFLNMHARQVGLSHCMHTEVSLIIRVYLLFPCFQMRQSVLLSFIYFFKDIFSLAIGRLPQNSIYN